MKFIRAILAAVYRASLSLINAPLAILAALAGFGGGPKLPDVPPTFSPPGNTQDLISDLNKGQAQSNAVRNPDRDGVTAVYQLFRATDRSSVNLEAVEREDVRDLLIRMSRSDLEALTSAGRGPIQRLLSDGDSGIYGIPAVSRVATKMELAARLASLKGAISTSRGTSPLARTTPST